MERLVGAAEIIVALRSYRFIYSTEKELQDGVARALAEKKIPFAREKDLGEAGVIDFCVGTIGIEIKTKGSPSEVARQLMRYCGSPMISELILLTGRTRLGNLPAKLLDKPLYVVTLWRTML
jgi:hypothetical protein